MVSPEGTVNFGYGGTTGGHNRTFTDNSDIKYGYDELGRLKKVTVVKLNGQTLSPSRITTYTYDNVGNLDTVTSDNGTATTADDLLTDYTFNTVNRLTDEMVTRGGSTTPLSQHYVLNADGTRHSVAETQLQSNGSSQTINTTWNYDALSRLTSESVTNSAASQSFNDTYTYDLAETVLPRLTLVLAVAPMN